MLILLAGCTQLQPTPADSTTGDAQEQPTQETENNEEQSFANNSCVTITTPAVGTTVSFPLTVEWTIDYGCRTIFEAQAWLVTIEQNGQVISPLDPNNGFFMVQWDYYDQSNYPVTVQTTIQNLLGAYTGPAELVITAPDPCGDSPECPADPAPLIMPIMLP